MKIMLSAKQWEKIEDKYGLLMHKISHNISGDNAISSHEDNLQDIKLAAMEAVIGFEKQHEGANGKFDDFGVIHIESLPYECMFNVSYITMVHRYRDVLGKTYSCLLFLEGQELPILVRQEYDDVISAMKKTGTR